MAKTTKQWYQESTDVVEHNVVKRINNKGEEEMDLNRLSKKLPYSDNATSVKNFPYFFLFAALARVFRKHEVMSTNVLFSKNGCCLQDPHFTTIWLVERNESNILCNKKYALEKMNC